MTHIGCVTHWRMTNLRHMTDNLLTTGEVAGMLGIARQTVWHRVQTGALVPVTKLTGNRGFLFNQSEIEALAVKEAKA